MEPKHFLLTEAVPLPNGSTLPRWTYVWKLDHLDRDTVLIEHRNKRHRIPARYGVELPVSTPSKESLCVLDPCFETLPEGLTEIHTDHDWMYAIHRCPHDHYFLHDTRGSILMYSIWIFLGSIDDPTPDKLQNLWKRHHEIPVDAIHHLAIGI